MPTYELSIPDDLIAELQQVLAVNDVHGDCHRMICALSLFVSVAEHRLRSGASLSPAELDAHGVMAIAIHGFCEALTADRPVLAN